MLELLAAFGIGLIVGFSLTELNALLQQKVLHLKEKRDRDHDKAYDGFMDELSRQERKPEGVEEDFVGDEDDIEEKRKIRGPKFFG